MLGYSPLMFNQTINVGEKQLKAKNPLESFDSQQAYSSAAKDPRRQRNHANQIYKSESGNVLRDNNALTALNMIPVSRLIED